MGLYLQATLVEHEKEILKHKKGVCLGSCLAPVACKIFILYVDWEIKARLGEFRHIFHVDRYVGDFFVIRPNSVSTDFVVRDFISLTSWLNLTREDSSGERFQVS